MPGNSDVPELARTGFDGRMIAVSALTLLVAGTALLQAGRVRRRASRERGAEI